MKHTRVKSSSIFSFAHDGKDQMEVCFVCNSCKGSGGISPHAKCTVCGGCGHTGTYHGAVPHAVFEKVSGHESAGKAFNFFIRSNPDYKFSKAK